MVYYYLINDLIFFDFLNFFFQDPISDPIRDPVRDPIREPIRDPVRDLVRVPVRDQVQVLTRLEFLPYFGNTGNRHVKLIDSVN